MANGVFGVLKGVFTFGGRLFTRTAGKNGNKAVKTIVQEAAFAESVFGAKAEKIRIATKGHRQYIISKECDTYTEFLCTNRHDSNLYTSIQVTPTGERLGKVSIDGVNPMGSINIFSFKNGDRVYTQITRPRINGNCDYTYHVLKDGEGLRAATHEDFRSALMMSVEESKRTGVSIQFPYISDIVKAVQRGKLV